MVVVLSSGRRARVREATSKKAKRTTNERNVNERSRGREREREVSREIVREGSYRACGGGSSEGERERGQKGREAA